MQTEPLRRLLALLLCAALLFGCAFADGAPAATEAPGDAVTVPADAGEAEKDTDTSENEASTSEEAGSVTVPVGSGDADAPTATSPETTEAPAEPTPEPSQPTEAPVVTPEPTPAVTEAPFDTPEPTAAPTEAPVDTPEPTAASTDTPVPSAEPTEAPSATPMPAASPTDAAPADLPDATEEPDPLPAETPEPSATAKPGTLSAELGSIATPQIERKQKVTLAVPVVLRDGTESWYSHQVGDRTNITYSSTRAFSRYSLDIAGAVDSLSVELLTDDGCPFYAQTVPGKRLVVGKVTASNFESFGLTKGTDPAGSPVFQDGNGSAYHAGDLVNTGFAVFPDLVVLDSVRNGDYTVSLRISWESAAHGNGSAVLSLPVTAINSEPSTGGTTTVYYGGGGGGGGSTATTSEAKLIVESVSTSPETPAAGDEFDLILQLKNTSSTQAVQNISVSCEADGDSVLPISGAFSAWIERIAAQQSYTLRMKVRAQSDIDDKPVKLYVLIDYEDPSFNAHSASQTVTIDVAQQMRIKLDEPVQPTDGSIVGETYSVSMGVFNLGRATLYNVTVTGTSDSEDLAVGASYYCGNMESGTSKTAELRFTPLAEGSYTVDLEVSYENGRGEAFSETKTLSFYSSSYEDTGWFQDDGFDDPEPTAAPALREETLRVMSVLPWWIYAAAGVILYAILTAIGVGARRRRIRALEEDEME